MTDRVFDDATIAQAVANPDQVRNAVKNWQRFEYTEPGSPFGIIAYYEPEDGRVLVYDTVTKSR